MKDGEGFAIFQSIDDHVDSNIRNIRRKYEEVLSLCNDNIKKAVETLSCITEEVENKWYNFTNAYIDLAKWICKLHFADVPENIIEKCKEFFEWYLKRLRLGILKIEQYRQQKYLGKESSKVFQSIQTEFENVNRL